MSDCLVVCNLSGPNFLWDLITWPRKRSFEHQNWKTIPGKLEFFVFKMRYNSKRKIHQNFKWFSKQQIRKAIIIGMKGGPKRPGSLVFYIILYQTFRMHLKITIILFEWTNRMSDISRNVRYTFKHHSPFKPRYTRVHAKIKQYFANYSF